MGRSRRHRQHRPVAVAVAESADLRHRVAIAENNAELAERRLARVSLEESVADLERAVLNDPGWRRFTTLTEQEFTDEGRRQLRAVCRLMSIANPLIRRGLNLRSAYVWASGVEITARADGQDEDEQDVQAVVAAFLDDEANQRAVTGPAARDRLEHCLGTDGELWIACFTRPVSGHVQTRVFLADEISEVIHNPEDRSEPWYYRRVWTEKVYNADGSVTYAQRERLYPDIDYRPIGRQKLRQLGGIDIAWDTPTMHVNVNRPEGWLRGIPDAYAAVNWARAYKEFLEQWATLMKALARFAWRLTAKGSQRAQARARIAQAPGRDPATGDAQDVGGTAITPMDAVLEAIPKSGATIDAESGRPLAMMVASALDMPVTMLLSDPGQTGARAVAETLDQPTELAMGQRRDLWGAVYQRLIRYAITEAVRAPKGALKGQVKRDQVTGREVLTLAGETDDTIDLAWPDLDETETGAVITAIKAAADTGTVPPEVILRLLLTALGVRDVDGIMRKMVGEDGEFRWPTPPGAGTGADAAALARGGGDPAQAGPGRMAPADEQPAVDDPAGQRQADMDWGLFGGRRDNAGDGDRGEVGAEPVDEEDDEDVDLGRFQLQAG
ncbi:hypothetical protein [Phytohabitans houttuyneae]|uniref:Phage portal protein n=1 Tax=Phytohabitans houttuyneae TaxID=1076126 RepID=A0A6V8KCT0_9ACTN|nr:hypothetical protein [Phytohabitans houttuyneae]GFJ79497.1 hypothetical protein Phou_036770 [Phytohabitans houttuyneae]